MVKFVLFGGFSVLITLYVCLIASSFPSRAFEFPYMPALGGVCLSLASALYLRKNKKLATLLALIGLGFVSQATIAVLFTLFSSIGILSFKWVLLFLLPGLGALLLYFIAIKQYLKPETNQFEFIKIKVGKVEQDILVYVPVTLVVLIVVYFKFLA